ncbi:MAG: Ig-like domain-containing protein [Sandaracinaceae bacterium]|nr:Ig-like domain-containing protein [Sandaracinaceae bacterium]
MRPAALALVALATAACDLPSSRELGTGPVVVASEPADGATGVDRNGPFRFGFDRPIFPRDAHRGRVRIQSGARGAFVSVWLEPVARALSIELEDGPLAPDVRYRMIAEGIHDLSLVPMAEPVEIVFGTGPDASPPSARTETFEAVAPTLARCASAGCHGAEAPALGLDLSSAEGIRATAIGVVAERSRVGTQADRPWHGAPTLAGLARIDVVGGVGRPAQSFLMYTLLEEGGAGHYEPLADAPSREELLRLSYWIRAGAPTP